MKKNFSNNKGVSLITLVITIIVIIILAAIVLFTSLTTVDNANYASFVSEYDEINSGTQAKLKNNILNGKSEEERNAGFKKVKVENAPGSFVSVSDGAIEGYLVDLDTIKVTGTKTGKGEVINETVTFGEDDVYIYDDEGKVYYAKGYSDGEGQPKYKLDEELNLAQKPTIDSIDLILSEDKSIATIKVVARPGNSGELTVTADGKIATKTGDNTYEIKVNKNGKILVIAKEAGGSSVSQEVEITGIEKPKCLLSYDANGGSNAPASEEFEEGKRVTISSTQPTRSGYKFLGWSEDRGATTATYRAGGTYSKGISTTLYAVWKSTTLQTIPTVAMADYVYGQTPSTPQISANPGNGTVTYYYATSSTGNGTAWSSSTKLEVGTYYMYAKITNMADYDDVQTERTSFKVTQAKGSISWEKSSVTTTLGNTSFENKFSKTGDGAVSYSSTNTNVATIDANGNVTVKGAGTTEIKATVTDSKNYTYENKTASYTLTIGKAEITSAKVSMSDYTYGQTPSEPKITGNAGNGTVTYYYNSSNSNSGGTVWSGITSTSLNAGTYYIYAVIAETDNYKAFTTGTTSFTIAKSTTGSISFGETTTVTKTTNDEPFTNEITKVGDGKVSYTSSNTSVATVDENGKVTIKSEGETTITATVTNGTNYTYANNTASYTLKVEVPVYYLMNGRDYKAGFYVLGYKRTGSSTEYKSNLIKTITFQKDKIIPDDVVASWDVSADNNGTVMAWLLTNSDDSTMYDLYIGADLQRGEKLAIKNLYYFFAYYEKCTAINNFDLLNTDQVKDMSLLFYKCEKLTSVNLSNFDTSSVTDMGYMFYECKSLTNLNLNNFDTSKVTNMYYMFDYCSSLTSLNVSNFDTSKVTNMQAMFSDCSKLTQLNVSNFDTSKVTNMQAMFSGCSKLTQLNVSNFDTSKVTNMGAMFYTCNKLTSLDLSSFDTTKVTSMSRLFYKCSGLTKLNISNFITDNVTNMGGMFYECTALTNLSIDSFNTSKATDMSWMFYSCKNLTSLNVTNFDTSNVTDMCWMFYGCSSLTNLNVLNFNTSKVTNMDGMFGYCRGLISLDLSNFNTSNVTNMGTISTNHGYAYGMFYSCSSLTSLDLSSFNTSKVKSMDNMFYNCNSLLNLNISSFDTSNVTSMTSMFEYCSSLENLNISNFNTSSVTDMSYMFRSCSSLTNLNISNFDTSSVTTMCSMFENASSLVSLDLSNFNTSKVFNFYKMFNDCNNLRNLNINGFDTSNVKCMSWMFASCSSLIELDLSDFDTSGLNGVAYGSGFNIAYADTTFMFNHCTSLKTIIFGSNFNKFESYGMFDDCGNLKTIISKKKITSSENAPILSGTESKLNSKNKIISGPNGLKNLPNAILYVMSTASKRAFESGENYLTVFGSDSDVKRDDGTIDIYRIRTIMELVGDNEVSVEIGSSYTEQGVKVAGMNANEDGTYTPFGYTISTSIKDRSGNVVNEIDTSRAGTYTITYKLSDASGEVEGAEISRTVKVTMIHSVANGPVLDTTQMKAVYWSESGDEFETTSFELAQTEEGTIYNTTLYNYNYSFDDDIYELGKDTYEVDWAKQPRWANAKTIEDGSYWVWIPRYAYKITYYTSNDKKTVTSTKTQYGSIDVIFLKGTSNNEYIDKNGDTQTLPKGYIVHPAFQAMTQEEATEGNRLGKWDEELEGIWVAKYEASQETSTDGTTWTARNVESEEEGNILTKNAGNTENVRVVSKPSVNSWKSIENKYIYQNCLKMNKTLSTHQMKNSEWGAVAYLTYSVYGRNGNELAVNQCLSYYTGAGLGKGDSKIYNSIYAYDESFSEDYAYNTSQGKLASTTGNIYGIYDISGGAWEYTASYVNNGHDILMTYGNDSKNNGDNLVNNSGVAKTIENMKTKQIYLSTTSSGEYTQTADYELCKNADGNLLVYGDAVYETSTSPNNNNSWCTDYSDFPASNCPFFLRGGGYKSINGAGVFFLTGSSGGNSASGFRPVICVSTLPQ